MTRAAFEPSSDLSQCDSVVALWSCRGVAMTLQEPSSSPGAQSEALVFLSFFWRFAGPSAGRQGHLSASGGPPVVPAGGAGGGRVLRRNRTVRRKEDRTSSKVPAVQGWDRVARPARRYFCDD